MKRKEVFSKVVAVVALVLVVVGFYNLYSYLNVEAEVDQKFVSNLLIDNSEYDKFSEAQLLKLTQAKEVGKVLNVALSDEEAMDNMQPGIYSAQITLQLPYNQKIQRTVTVNVRDTMPPVITSPATMTVTQGTAFPVDKVTVTDQLATTIGADALKVSGFDPNQVGEQKVQLQASDTSGNTTKKEVVVIVKAPEVKPVATESKATPPVAEVKTEESVAEKAVETPAESSATENTATKSSEASEKASSESTEANPEVTDRSQETIASQDASTPEATTVAPRETSVLRFVGSTVPFIQYGGASAAPSSGAGAWMGNGNVSDGTPTHFVGHNPGDFAGVMGLSAGSAITVVDGSGNERTYTVYEVIDVTDDGYNTNDPSDDVFPRMLYAGGERISLQTCINDSVNRCVLAR
ncbi:sortase domain-bontaining protein [Enterococcus asini]|uniref:sortase domain-containing protein n=1 Tax=Enterococcus asini TaxID=57732 RepID=UPI00241C26A6|nr:sortase [Enterococcus asini]